MAVPFDDALSEALAQVYRYKPTQVDAMNHNDLRSFVHAWFAAFDHRAPAAFFLEHLDFDQTSFNMDGQVLAASPPSFEAWYADALEHIPWDFHDILHVQIEGTLETGWALHFFFRHVGETLSAVDAATAQPFNRVLRAEWSV